MVSLTDDPLPLKLPIRIRKKRN